MSATPPATLTPLAESSPPPEPIARAAGMAGIATLSSRILGLARETVLAAYFGAGHEMDAYQVAFRLPNLLRDLFAEGPMHFAFVPVFTQRLATQGPAAAWRLANQMINLLLVASAVIVLATALFTTPLVSAYAGSFAAVPGKLALTAQLARVMLPFLTLVALTSIASGMLNALRHFFLPSISPAAFNIVTIIFAVAVTPLMPRIGQPRILAIALAVVIGAAAQVAMQWPALRREGFRYRPMLDLRDPGLREILRLMGPAVLGLIATQINLFIETLLATRQGAGAVSWLQYAFRLMYLPIGLFGISIATAVLPAVSRHLAIGDPRLAMRTVERGLALMLIVNVPATIGLLVLARPIVQLLLERGRFLPADTVATAAALQCYAFGLIGYSMFRIVAPVFYALGNSRLAVTLSSTAIALNIVLSLALIGPLGFRGLALANSIGSLVNGGLALMMLGRKLGRVDVRYLAVTLIKMLIASALMAAAVWASGRGFGLFNGGSSAPVQAVRLGGSMCTGLAVLAAAATMLRVPEFGQLIASLRAVATPDPS